MKNIIYCKAYNRAHAIMFWAVVCLIVLSGCYNGLNFEPPQRGSGLEITVRGVSNDARTLLPDTVFEQYELVFDPLGFQTPKGSIFLEDGEVSAVIDDLEDGFWDITAIGYVRTSAGLQEAAWGDTTIEVVSGTYASVTIDISASNDSSAPVGYFSWDVEFPADEVTSAGLYIHNIGSSFTSYIFYKSLMDDGSGSRELNPGYYMVTVYLGTEWKPVTRTTVIHIYSGMETSSKDLFKFTESDFPVLIKLSGNLDLKIDGQPAYWAEMIACLDQGNIQDSRIKTVPINLSTGDWEMKAGVFDIPTTVYFAINASDSSNTYLKVLGSETVFAADVSDIDYAIDLGTIAMSGNFNPTVNGIPVTYSYIWACLDPDDIWSSSISNNAYPDGDGDWKLRLVSFNVPTKVYFAAYVSNGTDGLYRIFREETVYNTDISGIDFSGNINTRMTLAGSIENFTVDGEIPYNLYVYAYRDPDYHYGYYLGYVNSIPGNWSYSTGSFNWKTGLYFTVEGYSASGSFVYTFDYREVLDTDILDIDLSGNVKTRLTLSGNIDINVDGNPPSWDPQVFIHLDPEDPWSATKVAYIDARTGNWSCNIPMFSEETDVYFTIYGYYGSTGYYMRPLGSVKVFDADKGGINFSGNYSSKFTLSGTIGDVKINGVDAEYVDIRISTDPDIETDFERYDFYTEPDSGSWTIEVSSYYPPVTVYIVVYAQRYDDVLGTDVYDWEIVETLNNVWETNIANISLGSHNFTPNFITLSGTIGNVTLGGLTPDYIYLRAYLDEHRGILRATFWISSSGGSWKLNMKSFSSSTPVYIFLEAGKDIGYTWIHGNSLVHTQNVHNTNVSGIALGNIDIPFEFINISGTIGEVTLNGHTPDSVYIVAAGDIYWYDLYDFIVVNPNGDNWELKFAPFSAPTDVYFYVCAEYDDGSIYGLWDEVIAHTELLQNAVNITGIDLGDFDFYASTSTSRSNRSAVPRR